MSIKGRIRTLKKLIKLSNNAFHEFGFRYLVNTAILELKQNKFAIFSPEIEERKIDSYSEQVAYKIWLRDNKITDEEKSSLKKELEQFQFKPKISIVISLDSKNIQSLNQLLHSLQEQIYKNFDVIINCTQELCNNVNKIITELSDYEFEIHLNEKKSNLINKLILNISGDYILFFNDAKAITSDALYRIVKALNDNNKIEIIYTDEDIIEKTKRIKPFFKPDWSPDLFLSQNYLTNFYVLKKNLVSEVGGFREQYREAKHYDLLLRLTDVKRDIYHITKILVSVGNYLEIENNYFNSNSKYALEDTLNRRKIKGKVLEGIIPNTFRIKYEMVGEPKVSIIIPTRDQKNLLERCINAIKTNTSYKNYEIIVVDNNSIEEITKKYLNSLPYKVIKYEHPFNFSKINNLGVKYSTGEYLLFLNDDAAPLESGWLENMLEICQQEKVGVVGAKLVLSDNMIQHAGWVFLKTGAGIHPFSGTDANSSNYNGQMNVIRNYSAVTGACMLMKKHVFEQIGGFDDNFDLYYGDSDVCLKAIQAGYRVVYTPYAKLLHQGSSSIKKYSRVFFSTENHYQFISKWKHVKNGDPYYNPNLKLNYRINLDEN